MKKFLKYSCIIALLIFLLAITVSGHSGRTDSNGGHYNHSTGEYHYHHGSSAHQHYDMDGDGVIDCPYEFKDKTLGHILLTILKIIWKSLEFSVMGLIVWVWVFIGLFNLLSWICEKILKKEEYESAILKITIVIIAVVVVIIATFTVLGSEGII